MIKQNVLSALLLAVVISSCQAFRPFRIGETLSSRSQRRVSNNIVYEALRLPSSWTMGATVVADPEKPQMGMDDSQRDPLEYIASRFESIYNRALDGKPAQLKGMFSPSGKWEGLPLAEGTGIQEALDALDQARSFMINPCITVTDSSIDYQTNKVHLEWQLSGTWPFPYRPRVIAAGSSTLTLGSESTVIHLEEKWEKAWWKVVLEQALPRKWDLWHLYLTPPAEKPLYRVLKKLDALEIREYYPRTVIELEMYDTRPDVRFSEYAWILPDFGFTGELKLQGRSQYRETYVTTSPVESCVESVLPTTPVATAAAAAAGAVASVKRIRWHIPLPSHLGQDIDKLPVPEVSVPDNDKTPGEKARYIRQQRRYVAVRPFNGRTQTDNYATARRWLLSWCQKEKLKTLRNEMGKSQVWVQQHNMKAGFNMAGNFCLGIYEQPSYSDFGEIAVEIEKPDFEE